MIRYSQPMAAVDTAGQVLTKWPSPLLFVNILIVEDEATSREMLLSILKSEGDHRILTAADGDEALKLMEDPRHPFDVVFLDLMLAVDLGVRSARERVRATPACRYRQGHHLHDIDRQRDCGAGGAPWRAPLHGEAPGQDPGRSSSSTSSRPRSRACRRSRSPRRPRAALGSTYRPTRPRSASTLESMERWLTEAKAGAQSARPGAAGDGLGKLKTEALELGLREVGAASRLSRRGFPLIPSGDVPDSTGDRDRLHHEPPSRRTQPGALGPEDHCPGQSDALVGGVPPMGGGGSRQLDGVQIDPKEWWDGHWIRYHVARRVDLPGFNKTR